MVIKRFFIEIAVGCLKSKVIIMALINSMEILMAIKILFNGIITFV